MRSGIGQLSASTSNWKKFGLSQAKKSGGTTFWNSCKKNLYIQEAIKGRFDDAYSDEKPLTIVKAIRPEAVPLNLADNISGGISKLRNGIDGKKPHIDNFGILTNGQKVEKCLLQNKLKTPFKFFALPNFSVQVIGNTHEESEQYRKDWQFFHTQLRQ